MSGTNNCTSVTIPYITDSYQITLPSQTLPILRYRDAQLGFLQVQEDETSRRESPLNSASSPRLATFLVIYAPRRGILEVWTMEQVDEVVENCIFFSGTLTDFDLLIELSSC